mmetsp:Transcript_38421/g.113960  ORF Transcript_38421/g.113960 Transcript_38421/m.113960 type:complete len:401 (+) Transcript_38421:429-1631(+)
MTSQAHRCACRSATASAAAATRIWNGCDSGAPDAGSPRNCSGCTSMELSVVAPSDSLARAVARCGRDSAYSVRCCGGGGCVAVGGVPTGGGCVGGSGTAATGDGCVVGGAATGGGCVVGGGTAAAACRVPFRATAVLSADGKAHATAPGTPAAAAPGAAAPPPEERLRLETGGRAGCSAVEADATLSAPPALPAAPSASVSGPHCAPPPLPLPPPLSRISSGSFSLKSPILTTSSSSELSSARCATRKPFCSAPAELGSSGQPDNVYPGPDAATLAGSPCPDMASLMKWRCAWDLTASMPREPMAAATDRQSRPCSSRPFRNAHSSWSFHGLPAARGFPVSLRGRRRPGGAAAAAAASNTAVPVPLPIGGSLNDAGLPPRFFAPAPPQPRPPLRNLRGVS